MTKTSSFLIGTILAAISVTAFAATFVVGSSLTKNHGVSAEALAALRFVVAGGAMLLWGLRSRASAASLFKQAPKDWLLLAWLGPIGTFIMAWCVFKGCSLVSTANASMADALAPLFIFALATIRARHITLLQTIGCIFGFVGVLLTIEIITTSGLQLSSYCMGDVYIMFAALTWAFYSVCGREYINRKGSYAFTCLTMVIGAVIGLVILACGDFALPHGAKAWALTVVLGLVCTLTPFWAWNAAQKYLSMTFLAVTAYFTPVVAVLLALIFLGEKTTWLQWIGTLFVCASALVEAKESDTSKQKQRNS